MTEKKLILPRVKKAINALRRGDYFATSYILHGIYEILLKEEKGKE